MEGSLWELCPVVAVCTENVISFLFPLCAVLLTPATLLLKSGIVNHLCHHCLPFLKYQLLMWLTALSFVTQISAGSTGNRGISPLSLSSPLLHLTSQKKVSLYIFMFANCYSVLKLVYSPCFHLPFSSFQIPSQL